MVVLTFMYRLKSQVSQLFGFQMGPTIPENGKIEKIYPSRGSYGVIIDENSGSGLSDVFESIHASITSVIVTQSTLNLQQSLALMNPSLV